MFVFTIIDLIAVPIIAVSFLMLAYYSIKTHIKQSRCKHESGVNETQVCDAICRECGKNLGFIGSPENKIRRKQ